MRLTPEQEKILCEASPVATPEEKWLIEDYFSMVKETKHYGPSAHGDLLDVLKKYSIAVE